MPSLYEIAAQARNIHERLLASSLGHTRTGGSCLYACILLSSMVEQFGSCTTVAIRGGDGKGDGGYRDASGAWHGHYWVEVDQDAGPVVLDITADQFGGSGVVVCLADEAQQYVAGDQNIVDAHVVSEKACCQAVT